MHIQNTTEVYQYPKTTLSQRHDTFTNVFDTYTIYQN